MTQINYLVTNSERLLGVRGSAMIAPSFRRPAIALAAVLVLATVFHGLAECRLAALARDQQALTERFRQAHANAAAVDREAAHFQQLRALEARIVSLRTSGVIRANEIAALGNALPVDASLSSIRVDSAGYALEGDARGLTTISAALRALAKLRGFTAVRLVSARADRERDVMTYSIAVERRP